MQEEGSLGAAVKLREKEEHEQSPEWKKNKGFLKIRNAEFAQSMKA